MIRLPPRSTRTYTLCPYTTLFRSIHAPLSLVIGCHLGLIPRATVIGSWRRSGGLGVRVRRRSFAHCGTSPLPHPATQCDYPMGGRVGERAGAASEIALSRLDRKSTRLNSSH